MATKEDTLTVHMDSLGGDPNADAFLSVIRSTLAILVEINRQASELGSANLEWTISDVGMSSPLRLTLSPINKSSGNGDDGPQVINAFMSGLERLQDSDDCPPLFTEEALKQTAAINRVFAAGLARINFETKRRNVLYVHEVASHANQAIGKIELNRARQSGQYVEYGSIEGYLKLLAEQVSGDKLEIEDDLTGLRTKCYVRGENLEEKIRLGWKHRVMLTGDITVNRLTGQPTAMQVDDVQVFAERDKLPQMKDLFGIDITGGVEPSEYVRDLRDGDEA